MTLHLQKSPVTPGHKKRIAAKLEILATTLTNKGAFTSHVGY
jgi:hypothetical protein